MKNTKTLTRVALLVAIELVMKMVGLGSVPVGPLYMSFLTLPIAVGAITMGPAVGALLGGVFGAVSFYDAITGASAMTGALFQVSPVNTFILCVGMRVLMGLCCGGGITFHPNEGKEEHYNLNGGRPRQAAEFEAFARALESGDQELCGRMQDTTIAVSRVLTVARRNAGIRFPCDH